MKHILLILAFVLICFHDFGQEAIHFSYNGIYRGRIEMNERKTEVKDIEVVLELVDSIYYINLFVNKKDRTWNNFKYIGLYATESVGNLVLKGKHPFQSSTYTIQQQRPTAVSEDEKRYDHLQRMNLTIHIKLKEAWFGKKHLKMELNCLKVNQKDTPKVFHNYSHSYLPEFYSGYCTLFKNKSIRDSVFQSTYNKQGMICSANSEAKPNWESNACAGKDDYSFKVDSIRFDTAYVNKLEIRNDCNRSMDTICLTETVKVRLDYFTNYYGVAECEIFTYPAYTSEVLYTRKETDYVSCIRILDYVKDEFGLEWIRVELDLLVYNEEEVDDSDHSRVPQKVIGWVFQKALHTY
ncbi:hypothetical protein [Fluviicola sp.]|uniref:hypothetical protein n=1 Tax=Fluviicola sp. TaxID=1917219 RepID=UPI003D2E55BE